MKTTADWLGNPLAVGDWILYSSTSAHRGINLGKITYIGPHKSANLARDPRHDLCIQVKIEKTSTGAFGPFHVVTLSKNTGAFRSITKISFNSDTESLPRLTDSTN